MFKLVKNGSFYSKKSYRYHEYADLLPLMNEKELRSHAVSIKENGQQEDIVLLSEEILDGRNTYLACHMFNITPRFRNYDNPLDPLKYVKVKNIDRRNLRPAQKSKIILKFLEKERTLASARQIRSQFKKKEEDKKFKSQNTVEDPGSPTEDYEEKGRAIDKTAKEFEMSPKTVKKIVKIENYAKRDLEIRELWEKAKKKEISLEKVYKAMKRKQECIMNEAILDIFHTAGHEYIKNKNNKKNHPDSPVTNTSHSLTIVNNPQESKNLGICDPVKIAQKPEQCCYYCSNVKILRCLKCDRKCASLVCAKGHSITFKNHCIDFCE